VKRLSGPFKKMMNISLTAGLGLTEADIKGDRGYFVRKSGERQKLDKELCGCLLAVRRFWRRRRGLCIATA